MIDRPTPPLEQPNRTIGSRTDHRAVAEVYGRAFSAMANAGHQPSVALDAAKLAVREFVALLRDAG